MNAFFIFLDQNRDQIKSDLKTNATGDISKEAKVRYDKQPEEDLQKVLKTQAELQAVYDKKVFDLELKGHFEVSHESFPEIKNSSQLLNLLKTKESKEKV